jgi:hypothetical protein
MNHHLDIECIQRAGQAANAASAAVSKHLRAVPNSVENGTALLKVVGIHSGPGHSADQELRCGRLPSQKEEIERSLDSSGKEEEEAELNRGVDLGLPSDKTGLDAREGSEQNLDRADSDTLEQSKQSEGTQKFEDERGRELLEARGSDEAPGDFEVMPTLNEWLSGENGDGGGPVPTTKGAASQSHSKSWCKKGESSGRVQNTRDETQQEHSLSTGPGRGIRNEHHKRLQVTLPAQAEENLCRRSGQERMPRAGISDASEYSDQGRERRPSPEHNHTDVSTGRGERVEELSRSQRAPADQFTEGRKECQTAIQEQGGAVPAISPARREPVHTLLGMVHERGQRPLFGLSWAAIQARQPSAPKGHYLVENFLTEEVSAKRGRSTVAFSENVIRASWSPRRNEC